jgi:ATP-binding cassette subfamily B protein
MAFVYPQACQQGDGLWVAAGATAQPLFVAVQRKLSQLNDILQENLAGVKVVKSFVRERQEFKRFDDSAADFMNEQIRVAKIFSFLFPVVFLIANLGQAAVLYFGGVQIIGGTLTLGEWQKFSLYLIYVFFPIGQLGFIISQMSQASASATTLRASSSIPAEPSAQCRQSTASAPCAAT